MSYLGKKISPKEEFTYSSKDLKIKFPVSGDYEFNVVAKSNQGKEVIKKQIIKVSDVKFNFDMTNAKKIYPVTENLLKSRWRT